MSDQAGIVAIVGRANVGKSTLYNTLIGRREAITAKEPGTTRDRLSALTSYGGKDFWMVDTAGVKTPEDDFELSIQGQIAQAADSATAIVVVVDCEIMPTAEDRQVAKLALKTKKPVVVVVNKVDTSRQAEMSQWRQLGIKDILPISALHRIGLEELLEVVASHLPKKRLKPSENLIKLAILGRPNVGKSSLFNSLAKKQQALVADQAGTTRDVNRLNLKYHQKQIQLLDTAGLRRSGKINPGVERFSVLRALSAIEESDICLLVLDISEPITHLDQKIAGMIKQSGRGLILVLNKTDLAKQIEIDTPSLIGPLKEAYEFVPWAPLVFTSTLTGEHVNQLLELAMAIDEQRRIKFKPAELNRWLTQATAHHPPAGLRNRHPSLKFIIQETDQPLPSFKVFGRDVKFLHWSYRRYLEGRFRDSWPLAGTPLKFWFIDDSRVK